MNFWLHLKKPFICQAPMADVTDAAFRRVIAKYGKPDVMWTEFVSADGLCSVGRKKLLHHFIFSKKEKPIVAQLFTSSPSKMKEASALVQKLGFDGVDINMGCPDRSIEKSGAGAALMKNPKLARLIIQAAKEGAPKIPVSVKTRVGYKTNDLKTWLPELLAESPAAITIHARTRRELSDVPARWEMIAEAVAIRDSLKSKTLIIGNGDVLDLADAKKKAKEIGADGIMIGRGFFGKPFLLKPKNEPKDIKGNLKIMLEQTKLFEKLLGNDKNFAVMKKHFKAYVSGFDGAKELRIKLMETENLKQVENILRSFLRDGKI